jgi:hypothetical protein
MSRAMHLESFHTDGQHRIGTIHHFLRALRIWGTSFTLANPRFLLGAVFEQQNSFMEMTKKMMHVCENYGNWFIYIRTTINPVVFVEFLRG